jgi:hypothetical protein
MAADGGSGGPIGGISRTMQEFRPRRAGPLRIGLGIYRFLAVLVRFGTWMLWTFERVKRIAIIKPPQEKHWRI